VRKLNSFRENDFNHAKSKLNLNWFYKSSNSCKTSNSSISKEKFKQSSS